MNSINWKKTQFTLSSTGASPRDLRYAVKGRIDLVLGNFTTAKFEILRAGFDVDDIKSLIKIEALTGNLEMATGKLTDQQTSQRLRVGFQQLKDIGTYKQIMNKWGLAESPP